MYIRVNYRFIVVIGTTTIRKEEHSKIYFTRKSYSTWQILKKHVNHVTEPHLIQMICYDVWSSFLIRTVFTVFIATLLVRSSFSLSKMNMWQCTVVSLLREGVSKLLSINRNEWKLRLWNLKRKQKTLRSTSTLEMMISWIRAFLQALVQIL